MQEEQKCYPALPVVDPAPTVIHVGTQQAAPPQGRLKYSSILMFSWIHFDFQQWSSLEEGVRNATYVDTYYEKF